jgi:hypothetical protein
VEVHCTEGKGHHSGTESCAVARESGGEALTGVRIGQPSSRENGFFVPNADTVLNVEGNMGGGDNANIPPVRRGLRPWRVRTLFVSEPGDLGFGRQTPPARIGKARSRSR